MKKIYIILLLVTASVYSNAQCPGPTVICQDHTVYLDGNGNGILSVTDIDGGSTDACSTGSLTFNASQTTFTCADLPSTGPGMIITGVFDGPLVGGFPKGIELFVTGAITDLSAFGIGSANNGGGTAGVEFTFPAISVSAGTFLYASADSAGFHNFYGFPPNFVTSSMSINGDDAIELFQNSLVIDVFGDIAVDGTGQSWEYLDGWAYKNDFEPANNGVWSVPTFYYSGINALDGELTNAAAVTPFPIGSYASAGSAIPVTLTVTDALSSSGQCTSFVTVSDTLPPIPNSPLVNISIECSLTSLTPPTATDNCSGAITGTTTTTLPITSTTVVVWSYVDIFGNTSTQNQTVTITDFNAPVPDVANLPELNDACEVTPTAPSALDACEGTIVATTSTTFPITASTTITWTYDDGSGNTSTQDQTVTITGLDVSTTLTSTTSITANATGVSYQWINCFDFTDILGETNQSFSPAFTGDYAVVISGGSCSDTSDCFNIQVGGIEALVDLGMTISPNPSTGKFVVSFDHVVTGDIFVYDANGRKIASLEIGQNDLIVDLTAYPNGVYTLEVSTEKGTSRNQIVKY